MLLLLICCSQLTAAAALVVDFIMTIADRSLSASIAPVRTQHHGLPLRHAVEAVTGRVRVPPQLVSLAVDGDIPGTIARAL